jgi:hypothetical protein
MGTSRSRDWEFLFANGMSWTEVLARVRGG